MAQLFKTISLEERLKNSSYNSIIQQPKAVQQGSTVIQPYNASTFLANNSTIQITPFGIFNHTSNLVIQPYNSTIIQGGNNPTIFNFIPNQGGITPSIINISLNQGGLLPNTISFIPNQGGVMPSNINYNPNQGGVSLFFYNYLPIQGSTTLSSYLFAPNQGGVNPTTITFVPYQGLVKPPPHLFIPNQGSTTIANWVTVQNQGGVTPILFSFIPNQGQTTVALYGTVQNQGGITPALYKPIILQGGVLPKSWAVSIEQGGTLVKSYVATTYSTVVTEAFQNQLNGQTRNWILNGLRRDLNPTAKQGSIILNVLRYETDRALAAFTPEIKHGGTFDEATLASRYLIPQIDPNNSAYTYTTLLKPGATRQDVPADSSTQLEPIFDIIYDKLDLSLGVSDGDLINNYKARSYYSLGQEAKNRTSEVANKSNTAKTLTTGTKEYPGSKGFTDVGELGKDVDDFIKFKVSSIRDKDTSVSFKAYLTAFNDSYTVNWNDINYVGRQETLKAFKGVTRGVSLSFKTAAMTRKDMQYMYQKLNKLVQITAIGALKGATYVYGPICSLTLGNWFINTVCVFNSVKFDVQPTEYSWDVGIPNTPNTEDQTKYELPHIVDVSLDATILLTNDSSGYDSKANFFSKIPT